MIRKFIWKGTDGKGMHLVGWDKIIRPKSARGLGVRVAWNANNALLGKLVWDIHIHANKLWEQVLSNKYLSNLSVLEVHKKNSATTWNSILNVRSVLCDVFVFRLGNDNTSFWYSSRTKLGTLASVVPWFDIHDISLCICDLNVDGKWNFNLMYTLLPSNIQD